MALASKTFAGLLPLLDALTQMVDETAPGDRRVVALAGPPGAGKSTLAAQIADRFDATLPRACAVLAMDGFHLDDAVLQAKGWSHQKGAPHSFDVGGLASTLDRIKRNDESFVAVPEFDRSSEMSRAAAVLIDQRARLVVVEGNYLLCDQPGWSDLHANFDLSIMLKVDESVLRHRLVQRWQSHGFATAAAGRKAEENDLPNARFVVAHSVEPDWSIDANG